MYNIKYEHRVEKDLKSLPKDVIRQTLDTLEILLKENPFAGEKLEYKNKYLFKYRIRNYRVIYTIDTKNKEVIIVRIRHRKDVYRGL